MEVWYCNNCGSSDVQEKVWIAVNSGKVVENKLWYEYKNNIDDEYFFCNECREECGLTTKKEKGETDGKETNNDGS